MGTFRGVELDGLELSGDRLVLRRWRPDDAEAVHAVLTDGSMHRFLALPDPYTPEDAARFVSDIGNEGRADGTGVGCAIVERSTGRLAGAIALRLTGQPRIDGWVAPAARGRGYAADATRMLAAWGFRAGVHRIELECDVTDLGAARTALAAGFRFEAVARGAVPQRSGSRTRRRGDVARFGRVPGDPGLPLRPMLPPLPPGGLSDGIVGLRSLAPADARALYEMEDDVAVAWGFTGEPPDEDADVQLAGQSGLDWLVTGPARMAIVDLSTGAVAGCLTIRPAGPPQIGSVGYVVHPSFRGRALTARALRLVIDWAFGAADFARLELGAKAGNHASQRAARSAGFEPDGVRRARLRNPDGTFSDEVRFAVVNPRYAG